MNNRQIYTYTDITKLNEAPYWEEIKSFPILTVTADLRKGFVGNPEIDTTTGMFTKDKSVKVCEFRRLSDLVLPGWTDDETKFRQTVVLSQFLRQRISEAKDENERLWLIGCRRNLAALLSAIILLEEADVHITEIEDRDDSNIKLLVDAWRYLDSSDPSIKAFHDSLNKLNTKEVWEEILCRLYNVESVDCITIHGFFYFTPLQQRIVDSIEEAGIKTIYLFHYDERYPYANEVWSKTYSKENGFQPIDQWKKTDAFDSNIFGEILEGRSAHSDRIKIKENGSIAEFIQYIKNAKESGCFIYSSNHLAANDILRDFYPEQYGERKLLSYPIGQFVNTMNELWDDDYDGVILNQDSVIECFSSGWLSIEGVSGKQYLQDVVDIMPFFSDCKTLNDWKDRVKLLKQIREDVIQPFLKDISVDEVESRWQKIMGNPLLNHPQTKAKMKSVK